MANTSDVSTLLTQHMHFTKKAIQNSEIPIAEIKGLLLRFLLLSIGFSFIGEIDAQSPEWLWAKAMGGTSNDQGKSIVLDASGNIYTVGRFEGTVDFDPGAGIFELTSTGEGDIFISKLDGSGSFEWAVGFGGSDGIHQGNSIAVDGSGNVFITGGFLGTVDFDPGSDVFNLTSNGSYDIFISKFDGSGNFIWVRSMGGSSTDLSNSIALDASGNVYTTGNFFNTVDFDPGAGIFNLPSAGSVDIFISKLDNSGNFVWAKAMGGTEPDRSNSIALDASGNVYTTGYFEGTADFNPSGGFELTSAGGFEIFISKLDNAGNFVWAKAMAGAASDRGYSIALDASANVYTTGEFQGTVDFNPGTGVFELPSAGSRDIFISKLDDAGNFVWAKAIGGADWDRGHSIALDASGNVYTTGFFRVTADFDPGAGTYDLPSFGFNDIFISKLDESGNFVFALNAGGTEGEEGNSIAIDASGNSYLTGYFTSPFSTFGSITLTTTGGPDIFVAKVGIGSGNSLNVSITNSQNVLCNGQNSGSATAMATGGNPPYTYNWSTGGSGTTIANIGAGTYTVTVTDNNGASATVSVTITQPPLLVLSPPIIIHVSCDGGDNGSIQASVTGGDSPYIFNWSNGSSGATLSNLAAGVYTVTVTDDNDCTMTATYIVTQPDDIVISLLALNNETCAGEEDGSITIDVTGGVNPILAEWSNGITGFSIVDLSPDTYSVTVTDINNCTKEATFTINPGGNVVVTLNQIQDVSCAGGSNGSISISASGGAEPYSYIWSNGATESNNSGLTAGSYLVTVTDTYGCLNAEEYTINQPAAIVIEIMQPTQNLCKGDSTADLTSTVAGGVLPYTALWSNGINGLENPNLTAGTYTVTVTDANVCTSMMSFGITDPPQLTVLVSTTNETSVGANDGTAVSTVGGGTPSYSYLWNNGATTSSISGLSPGTYTATITDMNGCTVSGSGAVNAFGCTLDILLGQDESICEGDTTLVAPAVAGASGSVTYLWTDGSTDDSLYVSTGGEYCVTVTDEAGCLDVECISITEIIIPLLVCPVTNESMPDANDGAVQCDSLPDIVAYVWSNGATTSSIAGLSPGEYCVTVTDVNGCTMSQCFNVQPANCQMTVAATQTDVSCHGDTTGSISLTVTGATKPVTYNWSNGGTSGAISNLIAGSYTVTVTDANGCIENQSFSITEPSAILIVVDSIAPVLDFDSGLIWITASGGIQPYSYQWLDPVGESFNSEDLNNLVIAGYYAVTVTDAAGCIAAVDSIFVDQDVAVDQTPDLKSLKVYPVPADDVLFVDMEIPITEVVISGADGRLYRHIISPGSKMIDVSDLGPGWYFLKVFDGSEWYFARMVKLRGE